MELLSFGHGTVTLLPRTEAIPAQSSSTSRGVTVNILNVEPRPELPVRFGVAFTIKTPPDDPKLAPGSVAVELAVHVPPGSEHTDATWSQIELAAARRLPSWLREVADAVEADMARTDPEESAER